MTELENLKSYLDYITYTIVTAEEAKKSVLEEKFSSTITDLLESIERLETNG